MIPYFETKGIVLRHANRRDVTAELEAAAVVISPPYNTGVAYDGYDDSVPESEHPKLARAAATLTALSLTKSAGRVSLGVPVGPCGWTPWRRPASAAGASCSGTTGWPRRTPAGDCGDRPRSQLRPAREPVICVLGQALGTRRSDFETYRDGFGNWSQLTARGGPRSVCGSGTTRVAVRPLGRPPIGIEVSEAHSDVVGKHLARGVVDFGGVA